MLDNEKILNNSISEEDLENISGGTYPQEVFMRFTLQEICAAQTDSRSCRAINKPCKMDDDYVWTDDELKALYESHGLTYNP